MPPTLVLVGRPNVGKSTLFNRLTGTRDALVHDLPGMTRDRHYGRGRLGEKPYLVVDTGGLEPGVTDGALAVAAPGSTGGRGPSRWQFPARMATACPTWWPRRWRRFPKRKRNATISASPRSRWWGAPTSASRRWSTPWWARSA